MTRLARREPSGLVVTIDEVRRYALQSLLNELVELLTADQPDTPEDPLAALAALQQPDPPDDPVLARLLPDAYADDPEAAAEFRRFTEADVRQAKVDNARAMLASLQAAETGRSRLRVVLTDEQAEQWLYALNDLRLGLHTALDVSGEQMEAALRAAEPGTAEAVRLYALAWLMQLQDDLVGALSGEPD